MDDDYDSSKILWEYVPEQKQDDMLQDLIKSLRLSDQPSLNFVASLVAHHSSQENQQSLLTLLERAIRTGQVDCVVSTSHRIPEFGRNLLSRTAKAVQNAKSSDGELLDEEAIGFYLSFAKLIVSHLPCGDAHVDMLYACVGLLHSECAQHGRDARDVIFSLLSIPDDSLKTTILVPSTEYIWQNTRKLILSGKKKHHSLLGYSLWLRLLLCVKSEHYQELICDDYWHLLLNGLRKGDTERRKLCLSILRTTIAAESGAVSNAEQAQYSRYCTVFETIVLGRYINQVQECKKDLDVLSEHGSIDPQWLFTLLASALDGQMQESNRKFIGNWIMSSNWKATPQFLDFLRNDFLPWAIQGSLFVSSLRRLDGHLRCKHGDRLANFLSNLLRESDSPHLLTDVVVETIRWKRNSLFAYTLVYLLEGLGTTLRDDQKTEISGISGLPEVARDYVLFRTATQITENDKATRISQRESRERKAISRCKSFKPEADDIEDLWSELDYLEYPKALVMIIVDVILHPATIECASQDQRMASSLLKKLQILQGMSHTRVYLFSPLVTAVRKAIARIPSAVEVLALDDFVVKIAEDPPVPTIDLMLEETTTHLTPLSYEHYFGHRPSYGFAALLDLVSRLNQHPSVVESILLRLLKRWRTQNFPPPTVSPWKNKMQLQILLLCSEQYNPPGPSQIHSLLEDMFHVVAIEPLPQYRYLLEWIIVRLIRRFHQQHVLLERLGTKDHHSNPKHLASLLKIGVILACDQDSEEGFAMQLTTSFVPLAASSKIIIRHEAQWQVPILMNYARSKNWTLVTQNPALVALDEYIRSLERFHDPPPERQYGLFNPEHDHSLTNLVEGRWHALDTTEQPLTSRDEFVKLHATDTDLLLPDACISLGPAIEHRSIPGMDEVTITSAKSTVGPRTADNVSALQTKGAAYLARTLSDHKLLDARPNDLVVVASLVDNPYNLGGLSRVSEIFGALALCLQNQNVVSNKDFTSVSVSSHLHFPIVQLSATGVPEFLAERKKDGFSVVGIEQTNRSVILGSATAVLPEKVVLVVGSEKEGIPGLVLTQCDVLVEIPQQGITRSLNVQTAVAIVMFEYARQRRRV